MDPNADCRTVSSEGRRGVGKPRVSFADQKHNSNLSLLLSTTKPSFSCSKKESSIPLVLYPSVVVSPLFFWIGIAFCLICAALLTFVILAAHLDGVHREAVFSVSQKHLLSWLDSSAYEETTCVERNAQLELAGLLDAKAKSATLLMNVSKFFQISESMRSTQLFEIAKTFRQNINDSLDEKKILLEQLADVVTENVFQKEGQMLTNDMEILLAPWRELISTENEFFSDDDDDEGNSSFFLNFAPFMMRNRRRRDVVLHVEVNVTMMMIGTANVSSSSTNRSQYICESNNCSVLPEGMSVSSLFLWPPVVHILRPAEMREGTSDSISIIVSSAYFLTWEKEEMTVAFDNNNQLPSTATAFYDLAVLLAVNNNKPQENEMVFHSPSNVEVNGTAGSLLCVNLQNDKGQSSQVVAACWNATLDPFNSWNPVKGSLSPSIVPCCGGNDGEGTHLRAYNFQINDQMILSMVSLVVMGINEDEHFLSQKIQLQSSSNASLHKEVMLGTCIPLILAILMTFLCGIVFFRSSVRHWTQYVGKQMYFSAKHEISSSSLDNDFANQCRRGDASLSPYLFLELQNVVINMHASFQLYFKYKLHLRSKDLRLLMHLAKEKETRRRRRLHPSPATSPTMKKMMDKKEQSNSTMIQDSWNVENDEDSKGELSHVVSWIDTKSTPSQSALPESPGPNAIVHVLLPDEDDKPLPEQIFGPMMDDRSLASNSGADSRVIYQSVTHSSQFGNSSPNNTILCSKPGGVVKSNEMAYPPRLFETFQTFSSTPNQSVTFFNPAQYSMSTPNQSVTVLNPPQQKPGVLKSNELSSPRLFETFSPSLTTPNQSVTVLSPAAQHSAAFMFSPNSPKLLLSVGESISSSAMGSITANFPLPVHPVASFAFPKSPRATTIMETCGSYRNTPPRRDTDSRASTSPTASPHSAYTSFHRNASQKSIFLPKTTETDIQDIMQMGALGKRTVTFLSCQVPELGAAPYSQNALERMGDDSEEFLEIALRVAEQFNAEIHEITICGVIMCWNAWQPYPFHEVRACDCALHLTGMLQSKNFLMDYTIGITSGPVISGTIGTEDHVEQSVVGNALGFVTELNSLATIIHSPILITESVFRMTRMQMLSVPVEAVYHDGEREVIFELRNSNSTQQSESMMMQSSLQETTLYMDAFSQFCCQRFQIAEAEFGRYLTTPGGRGDKQAARLHRLMIELLGKSEEETVFLRLSPNWILHEAMTQNMQLPEGIASLFNIDRGAASMGENSPLSPFDQTANPGLNGTQVFPTMNSPLKKQQQLSIETTLEEEIEKEMATPYRKPKRSASADTIVPLSFSLAEPPAEMTLMGSISEIPEESPDPDYGDVAEDIFMFCDRRGVKWRRSGKIIGKGTFGEVHVGLAEDGSLCAIKMLPIGDLVPSEVEGKVRLSKEIKEYISEVGLLSNLRHNNIVGYLSSAVVRSSAKVVHLAIVLEYVSGGTLSKLINHFGCLPLSSVRRYIKDVLLGLQFLHQQEIIHRDVSCNNVLLAIDGTAKLSDFGCSSSLERLSGNITGTPAFMAPEACRGKPCKASDIWSVGIMVYSMLTTKLPYPVDDLSNPEEFVSRVGNDETYRPDTSALSAVTQGFVSMCLLNDIEKRPSVEQLLVHPFFFS